MILAIDTSTNIASIALVVEGQIVTELTWLCGRNHTRELLPRLSQQLEHNNLSLDSTECVVVATGPGSYNGLRVGVSTAKGLAFSLNKPIIGISSLEVAAYPFAGTGLPVCSIIDVGRSEVAVAIYQQKRGKWLQLIPEHITTLEALVSEITTKTVFCGELPLEIEQKIKGQLKQKASIMTAAARLRRAGYLAELGQKRFEDGQVDNTATLQPLYLRRPSITLPKCK